MPFEVILIMFVVLAIVAVLIVFNSLRKASLYQRAPSVVVVFRDPFALATRFDYAINPKEGRARSFGNMEFVTEAGQPTPAQHREFSVEDGKPGDTLSVTWRLNDGTDIFGTAILPASSTFPFAVTLTQDRRIQFGK